MSIKIGVIVSSTRPTRVGRVVADWFLEQVKDNQDLKFELIDLKEINLPFLNEKESPSSGNYELEHTKEWSEKIQHLDGFVFVTAEYNNGPPAPLKNAIDSLYHEWDKKPVAFIGYGTYGAVRAIDQLVNNTAKVGMMPLSKTVVGIMDPWDSVTDNTVKKEYVHGNMGGMIANLTWWTDLLKNARK